MMTILQTRAVLLTCFFVVASVGVSVPAARAQPPTSQVLAFTSTIPGQPDGPATLRFRLFDANSAGTLLFEETQTVAVAGQTLTVRIGEATAGGVPATIFRDNPSLWIAFAFDSTPDAEIGPRTAITSGGYAHAAALLAGPMVRTLNSLVGDVALAAGTNVTITPIGNALRIDAAGSGLTRVSHDGSLSGDGTSAAPLGVAAPLQLTGNAAGATISGTNSNGFGVGVGGSSPGGFGVSGTTQSGQGVAGSANSGIGVAGTSTTGTGVLGVHNATTGTTPGVRGDTVSTDASAAGVTGQVVSSTPGGFSAGVRGINQGTGGNGIGVWGSQNGAGWGVYGTAVTGQGVRGEATGGGDGVFGTSTRNGVHGQSASATDSGVWGENTGVGSGVAGFSNSGVGVFAQSFGNSPALVGLNAFGSDGVQGFATYLFSAGVRGQNPNNFGYGVRGDGYYAVFGDATEGGYAGFFTDGPVYLEPATGGTTPLCLANGGIVGFCSSSLRYKSDVRPFVGGLDIVNRLRPIAFTWKQGGMRDVGLAAEDVAQVESLLTFRNDEGEIEGVKYNQLSAVFVNAIVEQQAQIKRQQDQITAQQHELAALKALVCESRPDAAACP